MVHGPFSCPAKGGVDHGLGLPGANNITHSPHRDAVKAKITEVARMVTPHYL